jgi:uncharacterized protein
MKSSQKSKVSVIKSLLSEITYASKSSNSGSLDEKGAIEAVLQKSIKKRLDSISAFKEGGRDDLAATEEAEVAIYFYIS